MEEYRNQVINLHAIQSQNISKFTGNISNNTSKSTGKTNQIRLGAMGGLTPSSEPLPDCMSLLVLLSLAIYGSTHWMLLPLKSCMYCLLRLTETIETYGRLTEGNKTATPLRLSISFDFLGRTRF